MKGIALVLLCALVAVQARYASVVKNTRALAAPGENPWVVHLRIAVSTSGLLNTCAGTLIGERWILTAASCVTDSRFIWSRYGATNVINPALVTENNLRIIHEDYILGTEQNNIALIDINRNVVSNDNIAPIALASDDSDVTSGRFCGFGANDEDSSVPGEQLICSELSVNRVENYLFASSDETATTEFDLGAALVVDGVQVGILAKAAEGDDAGVFLPVSLYLEWIKEKTGIVSNAQVEADSPVQVIN